MQEANDASENRLTQDYLKEILDYDPETGVFVWKVNKGSRGKAGVIAGYPALHRGTGKTYVLIMIDKKNYKAHRLAFLYITGEFPPNQTDHKDGNGENNKWINLIPVTHRENSTNQRLRCTNSSGCMGVTWFKRDKKWKSVIMVNGKNKHQGYFGEIWDAICARKSAEYKYGFHPNHGQVRPL